MAGTSLEHSVSPSSTFNLRKGATFHAPSSPSTDASSPVLDFPSIPRRSPTCPKALEDLLAEREQRLARFFESIDRTFTDGPSSADNAPLKTDASPVPDFMVAQARLDDHKSICSTRRSARLSRQAVTQDDTSDSGLGTSISGDSTRSVVSSKTALSGASARSALITKSFSSLGVSHNAASRVLSNYAEKHIIETILNPVLREIDLKDFHPLIKDIPKRIGDKSITCLRDLEKTLLLLAPGSSTSKSSYLNFCNFTIQCIHATVGQLNEFDLQRPTDRPYTNNYFLDLTQQIREYANLISEARRKAAEGKALEEMDYTPDERLVLRDGLSITGKPASFAREKNGQVIPIGDMGPPPTPDSRKRTLEEHSDTESTIRSMGRRRKSYIPGSVLYPCPHCNQDFIRKCDLSKHEKKHTRPYKCPAPRCPFHGKGFTTDKERDRHYNDKHNSAPQMHACQYQDCQYKSKRESNCKQHMEKAHGFVYVRQKNKKASPSTPRTPALLTPVSAPSMQYSPAIASSSTEVSAPPTPNSAASPSMTCKEPRNLFGLGLDEEAPVETGCDDMTGLDDQGASDAYGFQVDDRRLSVDTSGTGMTFSSLNESLDQPSFFEEAMEQRDFDFGSDTQMSSVFATTWGLQQPTEARNHDDHDHGVDGCITPSHLDAESSNVISPVRHHFSPGARGNDTLMPEATFGEVDEGYDDAFQPDGDFNLFGNTAAFDDGANEGELFPELVDYDACDEDVGA